MGWPQIIFGSVLVLVLLFTSILYIVRQIMALRRLRAVEAMALEETRLSSRPGTAADCHVDSAVPARRHARPAPWFIWSARRSDWPMNRWRGSSKVGQRLSAPEQKFFARLYGFFWILSCSF